MRMGDCSFDDGETMGSGTRRWVKDVIDNERCCPETVSETSDQSSQLMVTNGLWWQQQAGTGGIAHGKKNISRVREV